MILDVATALDALGVEVALKLREDVVIGLTHEVRQHVQTSPMGHADHGLFGALVGGDVKDGLEGDDRRLRAFEAKALLADGS